MFDHLSDPDPPTDTSEIRRHVEQRLRRRRRRRLAGGTLGGAAIGIAIAVVAFGLSAGGGARVTVGGAPDSTRAGRWSPAANFLTVAELPTHGKRNHQKWPGAELQERDLATGKVETVLMKDPSALSLDISASFEPDGNVVVAISKSQCGGQFESIDPSTGTVKIIGTVSGSVEGGTWGLSVSANGKYLTYEAYPGCQQGTPRPTTTSAADSTPTQIPADRMTYLAVRNLATGATSQTSLGYQGDTSDGNDGPIWSPDGKQLAIIPPKSDSAIAILSAGSPNLATAKDVPSPQGCYVNAIGAWTNSGITASLICKRPVSAGQHNSRQAPKRYNVLEQVTAAGHATFSNRRPDCSAAFTIESSIPGAPAIVDSISGPLTLGEVLGGKRCLAPSLRVAEYDQGHVRTIISFHTITFGMPD
jgi:WD40-like Beta Propeller Repeat